MILTAFRQLQHDFEELIRQGYPQAMRIQPGSTQTPPMDFLKPDYTHISLPLHVSPIRVTINDTDTVDDLLAGIKSFLADFTASPLDPQYVRIAVSRLYLEYDPQMDGAPTVIRFDFVPWTYDGMDLSYSKLTSRQQYHEQPIWTLDSYEHEPKSQRHQLMKTEAIEVNVWMQNVVQKMSESKIGAVEFVQSLTADLRGRADEAQAKINELYDLAKMHDNVQELIKTDDEAARLLVIRTLGLPYDEVSITVERKKTYIVIDGRYVEPPFLFQYAVLRRQGVSDV